jgi:hypothetical protein
VYAAKGVNVNDVLIIDVHLLVRSHYGLSGPEQDLNVKVGCPPRPLEADSHRGGRLSAQEVD